MLKAFFLKKSGENNQIKDVAGIPSKAAFNNGKQNQGGWFSIEMGAVLGVALIASVVAISKSDTIAAKSDEDVLVQHIGNIIEASRTAAMAEEDRFESLTIEQLTDQRLLPEKWGDGSTANPHGGAYDLGDSSVTQLVITASGLNADLCTRGAKVINKNFSATCSGDTITVNAS